MVRLMRMVLGLSIVGDAGLVTDGLGARPPWSPAEMRMAGPAAAVAASGRSGQAETGS
ncbi:hypothetical protein ABGB18_20235 [Nonomuraea sp. B12E4]|uniref:hypothetical protein n=1 Tax=Nonomuraea sp. B12E4 TaxID=3153564 RepID=UPI00325C48CD